MTLADILKRVAGKLIWLFVEMSQNPPYKDA